MRTAFVFAAVLLAAPAARADILLSNLAEPIRATTLIEGDFWASQEFINDGTSSVLTGIRTVVGGAVDDPLVFAELRDGSPTGALLTSFTLPAFGGGQSVRTFTPTSEVTLAANASYWFILGIQGAGSFGWSYAEGNSQTGTGSFGSFAYSEDFGATWPLSDNINPYLMEISVRPTGLVPEPTAWALMILGFGAAGAALRRRRAVAS